MPIQVRFGTMRGVCHVLGLEIVRSLFLEEDCILPLAQTAIEEVSSNEKCLYNRATFPR